MPSISRILEILLYSLTIFVPWLLVTYYPFRGRLRLNANLVALFAAVMAAGRVALDIVTGLGLMERTAVLHIVLALVYVLCFFASVRAPLVEMTASLLIMFGLAFTSTTAVTALEQVLTPQLSHVTYSWSYTLILLALEGIIAVLHCLLYDTVKAQIIKAFSAAKAKAPAEEKSEEASPAEAARVKETPAPAAEEDTKPSAPAAEETEEEAKPAPAAGEKEAETKPATVVQEEPDGKQPESVPETPVPQETEPPAQSPISTDQLRSLQFTNLNSRILESRQVRGEIRRQIDAMCDTLNRNDLDKLRAQMLKLRKRCSTTSYSTNVALSATLDYFAQAAANRGIKMSVSVQLSAEDTQNVLPNDLLVLTGNLLDNAMEACKLQQDPDRRITVSGSKNGNSLCFAVENTYGQPVVQDEDGTYQSTKYDGPGAGLTVVRSIAESYGGDVKIDHANGIFQVTVTLNA